MSSKQAVADGIHASLRQQSAKRHLRAPGEMRLDFIQGPAL
jgi:hypothetical protein